MLRATDVDHYLEALLIICYDIILKSEALPELKLFNNILYM